MQLLENELASIRQNDIRVSEYFSKVKSICNEISKLDPRNPITDTRMKRIIIMGVKPKISWSSHGNKSWSKEPTLVELESILANQEALDTQMSKVFLKDDEKALFRKKRYQ